eukprot:Nk52_evm25s242 gene=Nk52_evmTU25s242
MSLLDSNPLCDKDPPASPPPPPPLPSCSSYAAVAVVALVVMNYPEMDSVLYKRLKVVSVTEPYIAGFLAFREAPHVLGLFKDAGREEEEGGDCDAKVKKSRDWDKEEGDVKFRVPDVLLVDGNGIMHERGCGLASHLGVLLDIPTIGVTKNLYWVEGRDGDKERKDEREEEDNEEVGSAKAMKQKLKEHYLNQVRSKNNTDIQMDLYAPTALNSIMPTDPSNTTNTNERFVWGRALWGSSQGQQCNTKHTHKRSPPKSCNPIYVSVGHGVGLDDACSIVRQSCKYRIPEPIRQADLRSRELARKMSAN